MPLSPERARARARHNGLKSRHGADAPETIAARTELKALAAEEYIRELVAGAPPLTEEQRVRIAGLLRPVGGVRAA
jgi:hypothetical protein